MPLHVAVFRKLLTTCHSHSCFFSCLGWPLCGCRFSIASWLCWLGRLLNSERLLSSFSFRSSLSMVSRHCRFNISSSRWTGCFCASLAFEIVHRLSFPVAVSYHASGGRLVGFSFPSHHRSGNLLVSQLSFRVRTVCGIMSLQV